MVPGECSKKKNSHTLKFQGLSAMHFTRLLGLSTILHIFSFLHSWAQGYVWMVTYNIHYQKDHSALNPLIMSWFHCLKYKVFLVTCLITTKIPSLLLKLKCSSPSVSELSFWHTYYLSLRTHPRLYTYIMLNG